MQVKIGIVLQDRSKFEQLLGVTIDNKLKSNEPMRSTYIKAGAILNALSRVAQFMYPEKRHLIINVFLSSQFEVKLLFSHSDVP